MGCTGTVDEVVEVDEVTHTAHGVELVVVSQELVVDCEIG